MKELINLRKPREKHFLQENGLIAARVFNEDVHYLKNGQYFEIDNNLIETDEYFKNKENSFHVFFYKTNDERLLTFQKEKNYVNFFFLKNNKFTIDNTSYEITYHNILLNVDLQYKFLHNEIKDYLIIKNKNVDIQKLKFKFKTNMQVVLKNNMLCFLTNNTFILKLKPPTLQDNTKKFYPIHYILIRNDDEYILKFNFDKDILQKEDLYPFVIDPILSTDEQNNVYETYISKNNPHTNYNVADKIIVGTTNTDTYRTLIKFALPTIGTGSEVVLATANLLSYPDDFVIVNDHYPHETLMAHEITSAWNEGEATWDNMMSNYNEKVEQFFIAYRSEYDGSTNQTFLRNTEIDITNLVKRWYAGKENNGLMIKLENEIYTENSLHQFCSKNLILEDQEDSPKPYLIVYYKNFNGLEEYMTYQTIAHQTGESNINNFTGNLTTIFKVNQTINDSMPVSLNLIYNTNDVVLEKNIGLSKGYRWNYFETIEEIIIQSESYLEYVDNDGTNHYLTKDSENTYIDEEGLFLKATKDINAITITDKYGNKKTFTKRDNLYYLTTITNTKAENINLFYNSNNELIKITDSYNKEITLSYYPSYITITSLYDTALISFENDFLTEIETKMGNVYFSYNSQGLLEEIIDTNGLKTLFSYYDMSPYKMKEVKELGINNAIGNILNFSYGFLTTKVKNNQMQILNYLFNEEGNTINITNLDEDNNFDKAYGIDYLYASETKNALSIQIPETKYVNNLFSDPSFENANGVFIYDLATIETDNAHYGNKCVRTNYEIEIPLPQVNKSGYYTFSAYFKHTSFIEIGLWQATTSISETKRYPFTNEYKRYELTGYFEAGKTYHVNVFPTNECEIYMDDFQFEEGPIANHYNLITNSAFQAGMDTWQNEATNINGEILSNDDEIIKINQAQYVYQMRCNPNVSKSLSKIITISGQKGDTFRLSFWYKNEGLREGNMGTGNVAILTFYYNQEVPHGVPIYNLNAHATEWQYFERFIVAEEDYSKIELSILGQFNANNLYFTNLYLAKDLGGNSFSYDEKGNLIEALDLTKEKEKYSYNHQNQLIANFAPKGNSYKYEYANDKPEQLLQTKSSTGICYKISYNENNQAVKTCLKNVGNFTDFMTTPFAIRKKATNDFLYANFPARILELKEKSCHLDSFILEEVDEYYYIKTAILPFYFTYMENNLYLTQNIEEASLFSLIQNDNGSVSFKIKKTSLTGTIIDNDLCISFDENKNFAWQKYQFDANTIEFFLESTSKYSEIETRAIYNENGHLEKIIDSLGNTVTYNIDPNTNLIESVVDPMDNETFFTYNDKEQLTKIRQNNREVQYTYNENNLLQKITSNQKEFSFTYDEFLNRKETKINSQVLSTNIYEANDGNLQKVKYGNDNEISYTYDKNDRLKTLQNDFDTYTFMYDNLNNLKKITSNEEKYEYAYDFAGRVISYLYNQEEQFSAKDTIEYAYDQNSNITKKNVNGLYKTEYAYDEDDNITTVSFDNIVIQYEKDEVGRIKSKNINGHLPVYYTYYRNGNKTSFVLKTMKIDADTYEYIYDPLYNLTKILKNNQVFQEYFYDDFNELICEKNYIKNKKIDYTYDNSGNILKVQEYTLDTSLLLHEDTYEYGNANWEDELTKFNNTEIQYDEIGNPIKIGTDILSWANGRELQSYQSADKTITYKYNKDGIRRKKIVNNVVTSYFVENDRIILEKTGGNMLYYIRDENNKLIGFRFNSTTYYYQKNFQDDIIGIYNNNFDLIASYEYDTWGKILSIKDNLGNAITDKNHIAFKNPFRYRSYYYDEETKLYYLNNRYYNPEWKRFLNADGIIGTAQNSVGYNLFTYVLNSPQNYEDSTGKFAMAIPLVPEAVSAAAAIFGMIAKTVTFVAGATVAAALVQTATETKKKQSLKDKLWTVYTLNKGKTVIYVGRTSNLTARQTAHKNDNVRGNYEFKIADENLPYDVARGREQQLILYYRTLNSGYPGCNKINGINPRNTIKHDYYKEKEIAYFTMKYGDTYVGGIDW